MSRELVALSGITKAYEKGGGGERVLDGLDLAISTGDLITISGPSGSGKTTLLNIIGLVDLRFGGTYRYDGVDVRATKTTRELSKMRLEQVGFIFQTYNLIDSLTVVQNVEYPLALMGKSQEEQSRASRLYLEKLGVGHRTDAFPDTLSAGERQRVTIARALAKKPAVLLADEPTGDLDRGNTTTFLEVLRACMDDEKDIACVVVSHDEEVLAIGRERYKLLDGRVVPAGT